MCLVMVDPWLASALETVRSTGYVGRERRRLEEAAFRASRGNGAGAKIAQHQHITDIAGLDSTCDVRLD